MKSFWHESTNLNHSSRDAHRATSIIAFGASVLIVALASLAHVHAVIAPPAARKAAPQFTFADSTGEPIRLSDFKGRVVLLDFWATWCHGRKFEIPWFMEYEKKYNSKGFTVIGVSMDDGGWNVVKPFIASKKMNYPVVLNANDVDKQYRLSAMPMAVLIDKQGRIADSHSGVVDKAKWEAEIKSLLAESNEVSPM
ncbi:MAG TPA: TlpA disulfide reductase family protein [Candidatus Acidoferrales bacterium]|nr:TlpA disulfide reductase family protein [Candidatus Acidoferrales bacterium]